MGTGPHCSGCSLEIKGKGFVPLEWHPEKFKGLLIVGEGAGEAEAREGLPFRPYAQSGSLLAKVMNAAHIHRAEVAICNVISCHSPKDWLIGSPWEFSSISHCTENYLRAFIEEVKPKVILAVGAVALGVLTNRPKGKYGTLDFSRGYVVPGAGVATGIPVIGTFHPAFIRRGAAHLTSLFQRDVRRAFLIATGKLRENEHFYLNLESAPIQYQTAASVEEAWEWARSINNDLPLDWDCETPRTTRESEDDRTSFTDRDIKLFQATQHKGKGIALPYRDEFIEVIKFILATPTLKVTQNGWNFDEPVASSNGIEINLSKGSDDVMVMFGRIEPDLPANLQAIAQYCGFPFPWKALGETDIEFYGVADVDALAWSYPVLKMVMERDGLWDAYVRYFRNYHPILRKMSERGVPISESKRLELKGLVEQEELVVDEKIRALVPEEVLGQKQKLGYKNPPLLKCPDCELKTRADHFCLNDETGLVENVPYAGLAEANGLVLREMTLEKEEKCRCTKKTRSACDVCAGSGIIPAGVCEFRWASLTEFNPNSSHQVKRFIRFLKHPVSKHSKRTDSVTGEASETTEVKELERLFTKTKHPIYPLLIEKRQLSKLMGVYVEGWAPGKDGRIHATFSHKATWQPSCCAGWTFVTTKRGEVLIADIKPNDEVWTHKKRFRKVTAVWKHPPQEMYKIRFSNGTFLTCTTAHRLLVSDYGLTKSRFNGRNEASSIGVSCQPGVSNKPNNGREIKHFQPHDRLDSQVSNGSVGVQSLEGSSLWSIKNGQEESSLRKERPGDSSMEGGNRRWIRVFDLIEEWKARVCSSDCNGEGARLEDTSSAIRSTSHQRGYQGQSAGQSSVSNESRASRYSLISASRFENICITQVECVGSLPVFDITVDQDESYQTGVVFSHNSKAPNIFNGIKRGRTPEQKARVKAFNAMQAAEPGHLMVNFDFRSFHAQTLACEVGNADYLRLAKLDQHSFVTCHGTKHPERHNLLKMSDPDLKAFFAEMKGDKTPRYAGPSGLMTFKEARDGKFKSCGLGVGFGLQGRKMYQLYQEDFINEAEAKAISTLLQHELFDGAIGKWQEKVKAQAAEDGFLRSKYGAIRRFADVQRWSPKDQKMMGGEQAESAIAFLPAANAFGYIRDVQLRLEEAGHLDRWEMTNSIYDSLQMHPLIEDVEECVRVIVPFMERPSEVLVYSVCPNGLSVEAEASVGESLAEMVEVKA